MNGSRNAHFSPKIMAEFTVETLSSCLVPMATDSCSISRLELTPWDLLMIQFVPIQRGLFFTNPDPTLHSPITFINQLQNSLSHALDYFPPLAGRLGSTAHADTKTSFYIDCNNAGAEFIHAVANTVSISDLVEPKYTPELLSSLFPLNGVINYEGVSKPLLGVQVTQLSDGFFVAITANHAVVDGTSFWHFINSWAELSRGLGMISKLPVFQRSFPGTCLNVENPISLPPLKQYAPDDIALPPLVQKFFHFSSGAVAKLKAKANLEAGTEKISSLQAITAHLWRSIVTSRCRQRIGDEIPKAEQVGAVLITGTRPRFPLPDGYFGNAFYLSKIGRSESEIMEGSLGHVAGMINELVGQQSREVATTHLENLLKIPVAVERRMGFQFTITSSPRHNVYGSDFGWGKPVAVRSGKAHKLNGRMAFFPAPDAGGIDVEVFLEAETMKIMEDDPEFLAAFSI